MRVVPIAQLKPAPYNPRSISDEAIDGLGASVKKFGLVQPLIWNQRSGYVVGGHQRLEVLKQLGEKETQVVVVDLSDAEEKTLNVTLNNPNIAGRFTDGLQELLTSLKLDDGLWSELEKLKLDSLLVDFSPAELGEQGALDKKTIVTCPSCGHEFQS